MENLNNFVINIINENKNNFNLFKSQLCNILKDIESEGLFSNITIKYIVDQDRERNVFEVLYQLNFTLENEERIAELIKKTQKKNLSENLGLVKYLCSQKLIPKKTNLDDLDDEVILSTSNPKNFFKDLKEYADNDNGCDELYISEDLNTKEKYLLPILDKLGITGLSVDYLLKSQTFYSTEYEVTSESFKEVDGDYFTNVLRNANYFKKFEIDSPKPSKLKK